MAAGTRAHGSAAGVAEVAAAAAVEAAAAVVEVAAGVRCVEEESQEALEAASWRPCASKARVAFGLWVES